MSLPSLIARVRALKGPDREVDAMVCAVAKYAPPRSGMFSLWPGSNPIVTARGALVDVLREDGRGGYSGPAPALTASVDAVLGLIGEKLPGWGFYLRQDADGCGAGMVPAGLTSVTTCHCDAPTPALALLLAFLNALPQPPGETK